MECKYSLAIADKAVEFFEKFNIKYKFNKEQGVFNFRASVNSKINKYVCRIKIRNDSFAVRGVSSISADATDPKVMSALREYICRVNSLADLGHFDLDFSEREISYCCTVDCEGVKPSVEMFKNAIFTVNYMFEEFGDGICDVIFANASPEVALKEY